MSTVPPPEPPTRRIDPVAPPPPVYERERVVEPAVAPVAPAVDPNLMFVRLEDAISSLRTGLIFVGVLAVIGIGLSIYAITQNNDTTDGGARAGVSSQRVAQLDDRIDRLSRQVQQARADARSAGALTGRVDSLSRSVSALRGQAAGGGATSPDVTQAITSLDKRLDTVEQQLQDLNTNQTTTP